MGNIRSAQSDDDHDIWWSNHNENCPPKQLSPENAEKVHEFKLEFARKHEKRKEIMAEKRKQFEDLRNEIVTLREENEQLRKNGDNYEEVVRLREEVQQLKSQIDVNRPNYEELVEKNRELRINISEMQTELQQLNLEVLDIEKERSDYQVHVVALKDVIAVSKQMLQIREAQLQELKEKVQNIEESLAGKEMKILSEDLRAEYERQLQNIRNLRSLYEERQRVDRREREDLNNKLVDALKDLEDEQKKSSELQERINNLETENSTNYDKIKTLESNLGLSKAECRQYQSEMTVINQLFSETLFGFNNSQDMDLDVLTKRLEENHGLLQNIVVNEVSTEVSAALPKVLLDLVNQVHNESDKEENKDEEASCSNVANQMNSAEEIVENLPKVWKVLIELLSHQKAPFNNLTIDEDATDDNPCYKVVQTAKGPSLVLSVSQTYIRLKDLILEKKSLEKETNNLKQLNTHLETRLQDQEKRLGMVSSELTKTWHVVGKLQKQHQLLHTQEKILRYELAQKRKLLTELKDELEYSREKWQQAREKNSHTEQQWQQLRAEFASRRNTIADDVNSSSGYSDERGSSSDEEPGYETDASESNSKSEVVENHSNIADIIQTEIEEIQETVVNTESQNVEARLDSIPEEEAPNVEPLPEEASNIETLLEVAPKLETSDEAIPGSSQQNVEEKPKRTLEEVLAARDERFKRLEGQCQQLVTKMTNTSNRSAAISNKLDSLHEVYGENSSSTNLGNEESTSREDPSSASSDRVGEGSTAPEVEESNSNSN